jgi:hypothetical protein
MSSILLLPTAGKLFGPASLPTGVNHPGSGDAHRVPNATSVVVS